MNTSSDTLISPGTITPGFTEKVLFYSHNKGLSETLGRSLQVFGCQVKFCDVENQFIDSLESIQWDVVVQEVNRQNPPLMDYYKRWPDVQPGASLWLLVESEQELSSLLELGREKFVRLFNKPYRTDDLFEALKEREHPQEDVFHRQEAQILVVNPDPAMSEALLEFISLEGYRGRSARSGAEAVNEIQRQFYHMALVDTTLSDATVWDLTTKFHETNPDLMVIVLADYPSLDAVLQVQAMRAEIYNYLLKPLNPFALRRSLEKALEKQKMHLRIKTLLEGLRRANQDLLQLNELKSQFLRIVSHDLRTPLTSLKGYSLALSQGMIKPDRYKSSFKTMVRECNRLEHLIEDLMDVVSIETGKLRLDMKTVSPSQVFRDAVSRFRDPMKEKGIAYDVKGLNTTLPKVYGDPQRLDQVLTNLIGNALKHTASGGRISVQFQKEDRHLLVLVTDTGNGIAPKHLGRVFDQFFQAETRGLHQGGLGLGLSIAKEVVQRHEGKIGAASEGVGKGSTFWFTIPSAGEKNAPKGTEAA